MNRITCKPANLVRAGTIAAIATVGAMGVTGPAAADTDINFVIPFSADVPSPCTGEATDWTGRLHIRGGVHVDGSGGFHLNGDVNLQRTKGVGQTSGDRYVGQLNGHIQANANGNNDQVSFGFDLNARARGQGPAEDFTFRVKLHVAANADGDVTGVNFQFDPGTCD